MVCKSQQDMMHNCISHNISHLVPYDQVRINSWSLEKTHLHYGDISFHVAAAKLPLKTVNKSQLKMYLFKLNLYPRMFCMSFFYVSSRSYCVLHQLCTKLGHMLISHCFPVVCFCLITVLFVYCHYVSFISSSYFYINNLHDLVEFYKAY